ncbi:peptide chain release factor N(5)-glutamine methyltransferase [soil metagenome]
MLELPDKNQQIRWLLKDKYAWSDEKTTAFFNALKFGQALPIEPKISHDLVRLEEGEPIAYVIGWVDFLGGKIDLSYRTLIPRPETEYWTGEVIKEIAAPNDQLSILDLCSGSGCIGIALLTHLPNITVDFSDIDPNAVKQTKYNLKLNFGENFKHAEVYEGHLFDGLSGQYDYIVCNPPYVDLSGEVGEETKYEPLSAIFAQKSGLGLIEEILLKFKKYLKNDGKLYFEFGEGQKSAIEKLARKAEVNTITFRTDQFGVIRFAEVT